MCNLEEIGGSGSMEASVGVYNFGEMEGNGVLDQWKQVCVGVRVSFGKLKAIRFWIDTRKRECANVSRESSTSMCGCGKCL